MRILIVEDDQTKLRDVASCLVAVTGVRVADIESCGDANSAKTYLHANLYDLLIIDISIPDRIDTGPSSDGGIRLLEELDTRDRFKVPEHIVGITAYAELYSMAQDRFTRRTWTVISYDPSAELWKLQLRARVEHVLAARSHSGHDLNFRSELAIICALEDPELTSVLRLGWNWKVVAVPGDSTVYHSGSLNRGSTAHTVHAAYAPRMGMPAAAILATKMINAFRPKYLAMPGITAGVFGRANPGDVIVADPAWDYGSGKHSRVEGAAKFSPSPHHLALDTHLRDRVRQLAQDESRLAHIRSQWPAEKPDTTLKVRVGPMASGAAVVADEERFRVIGEQHRQLLAVEMEAYSVYAAANEAPEPRPICIALKSVCDFGDSNKDDRYQRYAAYTSAQILRVVFDELL